MAIAIVIYIGFLALVHRRKANEGWLYHGLAFCLLALLEPFTQKYALAVLLLPAIAAAGLMKKPQLRVLIYSATILVLVQPLAPGASAQRLLQVLGFDFAATLLLTFTLFLASYRYYETFR
jgi:hypothetical protein